LEQVPNFRWNGCPSSSECAGRSPEPEGLSLWLGRLNTLESEGLARGQALDQIANAFADSEEAQNLFPFLGQSDAVRSEVEVFVNSVFDNLFNRQAEGAGLDFWADQIEASLGSSGEAGTGAVIQDIVSGAQNSQAALDATTVQNKSQIALLLSDELDEAGETLDSPAEIDTTRDLIAQVTSDEASVSAARDEIDTFVGQQTASFTDSADLFA
jgi:hypothetical protein